MRRHAPFVLRHLQSSRHTIHNHCSSSSLAMDKPEVHLRIRLFLDWDGTVTKRDTMANLFAMGKYPSGQTSDQNRYVDEYYRDYTAHKKSYPLKTEERTSVKQELDWLASLERIEKASVKRFVDAQMFNGLTRDAIDKKAECDIRSSGELSTGWSDLLLGREKSGTRKVEIAIITVNWCAQYIRSVLLRAVHGQGGEGLDDHIHRIKEIPIYGNEFGEIIGDEAEHNEPSTTIICDGNIVPTHSLIGGVHVAADKVNVIRAVKDADIQSDSGAKWLTVYVGDSPTDLAALLAKDVDVGIYVRPVDDHGVPMDTELSKVLARVGIRHDRCVDAFETGRRTSRDVDGFAKEIWWTRDLGEIQKHVVSHLTSGG